jgi:hypothetical protein
MYRWLSLPLVGAALLTPSPAAPQILPKCAEATLSVGGTSRAPTYVLPAARRVFGAGPFRLTIHGDCIVAVDPATEKHLWTMRAPNTGQLRWLAGTPEVAYVASSPPVNPASPRGEALPETVLRLDLRKQKWLTPLSPPAGPPEAEKGWRRAGAVITRDGIAVLLTYTVQSPQVTGQVRPLSYRVTCFRADKEQPAWSHLYAAAGESVCLPVFLMASTTPDFVVESLRHLSFVGDDQLLVCAGSKDDLRLFELKSGRLVWRKERIWEYERGFTGPSVWQHHMSRFGKDRLEDVESEFRPQPGEPSRAVALEAARKEYDRRVEASIVAGPEVVSFEDSFFPGERMRSHRIFVAVAKGPRDSWTSALSHCVVYELSGDGSLLGMVNLPRMVQGRGGRVVDDSVVWTCPRGGVVKVRPQRSERLGGFAPLGSIDCVALIDWYRELRKPERKAWLGSGTAGDIACYGGPLLFRTIDGGFVQREGEFVYHFPIAMLNLVSGEAREVTLAVPFEGRIRPPTTNAMHVRQESPNGPVDRTVVYGPYQLAIQHLEVFGSSLRIELSTEHGSITSVAFDISDLLAGVAAR